MQKTITRLTEIDKEIHALEQKLSKLYEERRETINYLNLNKDMSNDSTNRKETFPN